MMKLRNRTGAGVLPQTLQRHTCGKGLLRKGTHACLCMVVALCVTTGLMPTAAWAEASNMVALAATSIDTSWYQAGESTYILKNAQQFAGLAEIVNKGTDDFQDKTVKLSQDINGFGDTFTPVGSETHPFKGRFDGQGNTIYGIKIDATANSCVGLFGYAGKESLIRNVTVGKSVSLTRSVSEAEGAFLVNYGLLVGCSEGSIEQCKALGSISLDSAAKQQSKDKTFVIDRVGGLAGTCYGNVTDCTFSGSMSLTATSAPVSEYDVPSLIIYVGGIVGYQGDYTQKEKISTPDSHGAIADCINESTSFTIETPSRAGTDRFGESVDAQSTRVGGIAGYARGSVTRCTNYGYLRIPNATIAGGIVGSLRSVESTQNGNYSGDGQDEGSADDAIVCSECVNIGIVYAHAAVGGIVGQSGTYTTITGCMNGRVSTQKRETLIVGTRWNKPFVAGIVGRTYGDVSYCGNLGIVASATWDNEKARTLKGASGFYSAGVAGGLLYYTKTDTATGEKERTSPLPTAFNNYNAGAIETKSGFRARHIVGNNEGHVYDNTALDGSCPDDMMTFGESISDEDASGTAQNNLVCIDKMEGGKVVQKKEDGLKGNGTMHYKLRTSQDGKQVFVEGDKDSVFELLNSMAVANGWSTYWLFSSQGLNEGYPILNWQAASYEKTDLSDAQLQLLGNAKYTGGEAVPQVKATLNGKTLLQNVDFRVVPQKDAIARSSGKKYAATIEGIGLYKGTSKTQVSYDIDKGDLSQCQAAIASKTFDWEEQSPTQVSVTGPAGQPLDPSEYRWQLKEDSVVNAGMHDVVFTATSDGNYEGTLTGTFIVKKANFKGDLKMDDVASISYLGKDYPWYSASNSISEADSGKIPDFAYSGYPVKPSVKDIKYLDRTLVEDKDYVVLYADLGGSGTGSETIKVSKNNVGKKGGTAYGAVMVRYAPGSNFSNYENMIFTITDKGDAITLDASNVVSPKKGIPYENHPMRPVKVTYGGNVLAEGIDYDITYANNDGANQTARYTVVGKGRFSGEVSGTFEITDESPFEFTWEIVDVGGTPVAKITGFEYKGTSEDLFDVVIPEMVEKDGIRYAVAIIGEKAFGGSGAADFEGTSKLQVGTVSVPASVTTIEKRAFGGTVQYKPSMTKITFAQGSQLATIGESAFEYCENLTEIRIPAGVSTIASKAFYRCSILRTVMFETTSGTLPSSVAKDSFLNVGGIQNQIRIVGYEGADTVKKLAADNSATGKDGANGGRNFAFIPFVADLSKALIADIPDGSIKRYASKEVKPQLTVTLDGKTLVEGTDYTVSYANNNKPGVASATISGLGGYVGSASASFIIAEKPAARMERLAGDGARDTAKAIADAAFAGDDAESSWAVLARDDDFADAMSATGLAGALDAPIVLTDRSGLSQVAGDTLERLGVKNVYIIGGKGAMPGDFESELEAMGITAERVFGYAAWDTSVECAKKIAAHEGTSEYAVVAMSLNFQDALSMSSFAYKYHAPILLQTSGDTSAERRLTEEAQGLLTGTGAFSTTQVVVAGGAGAISEESMGFLGRSFERLWGYTGYDTSQVVASYLVEKSLLSSETVCVASGAQAAWGLDALAGAVLAGRADGVMLLVSGQPGMEAEDYTTITGFLADQAKSDVTQSVYVLGGTYVIPEATVERIENLW